VLAVVIALFSERPWQPRDDVTQPIPFSHRVHAGINHIPCEYCHEYARRSAFAGVPPVERCVGCHGINGGYLRPTRTPLTEHSGSPFDIRWNRVYNLPDFVRFDHHVHLHAGVKCQECHGAVQTMERIVPAYTINMGFCVNCHTKRGVTRDCFVCHY
jgi:hypothetical protein